MTKTPEKKRRISTPIIIAIISLIGICITTVGAIVVGIFPSILNIFNPNPNKAETITFRVTEISGISVPQAKVIILSGNDIHIQYTDSNGVSTFSLIKAETLRVFVETDQYEIYDQTFTANTPNPIEIRLKPKDISRKSVIVRVIDNKDDIPISSAEVILIVNGNIYSQITDSNGITKFTTAFPADEIDGDISVSVSGFKSEHQRVTLQADRVQDIRLDKTSGVLTVGFTGEGKEIARTPEANNNTTGSGGNNEIVYNCSSKSLTPEEIANCGTHEYQYTVDVVGTGTGGMETCFTDKPNHHAEGASSILIAFSEYGDKMSIWSTIFTKIDTNTYEGQLIDDFEDKVMITFNENGFERNDKVFSPDNGTLECEWQFKYSFK